MPERVTLPQDGVGFAAPLGAGNEPAKPAISHSPGDSGKLGIPLAYRTANTPNHRAIVLVTVVALAATVPIAVTDMRNAKAGALVLAHERTGVLDALRTPGLALVTADDPSADEARFAVDGREDTEWVGRPGELDWKWVAAFARPVHIGLLRASFGASPTSGVPTVFHWEVRVPAQVGSICDGAPA